MTKFISVKETSIKWNLSERSVRNYCALGRIKDAVLVGKTWMIPEDAKKHYFEVEMIDINHENTDLLDEKRINLSGRRHL